MNDLEFKALIVEEVGTNDFRRYVGLKKISELPKNDVIVKVLYSALNYKDALSARGHKGITRVYPHTPGVDAAGIVVETKSSKFKVGDQVVVTGYDLGMNTSGGFGQYISVPSEWVVPLPENLSLLESMVLGTAGFTVGLCIFAFNQRNIGPSSGKVLVTGSTGGVGSLAVAILSKLGYYVVASTGKLEMEDFLRSLGAKEVIHRSEVNDTSGKPLLPRKWIASIDNVGGNTLSTIIRSTDYDGVVASVGLVESEKLDITVYPFILRGVSLVGIDSAETKMEKRLLVWEKLSTEWKIPFDKLFREVSLTELNDEIDKILLGKQIGKVVVNLWE
ncbi:MAG: YhdH/YhfP family quinone oxidoreductase [Ignavibacteria bacterium]|nr:YhdH/YhfP family quinone oxidoreductase [Ignavibacteria bacterium]